MARGYVSGQGRKDVSLKVVFEGMTVVTHADVNKLFQNNLKTAGEFAKAVSDGDLTDNGMTSEESIRLIAAFEQSTYADLLDYVEDLTPAAVAVAGSHATQPAGQQKSLWQKLWSPFSS